MLHVKLTPEITYSTIFFPARRSTVVGIIFPIFVAKLDSVAAGKKEVPHQLNTEKQFNCVSGIIAMRILTQLLVEQTRRI